ncbi:MAG: hypothetical protein ACTTHG_02780 [Treponemataceae bacterium]
MKFKIGFSKHIIFIIGIEFIVGFILCIACGFIFYKMPSVALYTFGMYKFQAGLMLFFKTLPALFISGIIVSYSWAFGKDKQTSGERFSKDNARYLKSIMLVSLCCTILCFICTEMGTPFILNAQKVAKEDSANIEEYLSLAEEKYNAGDYKSSLFYAKSAIDLYPKYRPSSEMLAKIELALSKMDENNKNKNELKTKIDKKNETDTVPNLLKSAIFCFENEDYINAHYYASQIIEINSKNDANRIKATQIAAEAWNKLSETKSFENDLSKEIFETKKSGYRYLKQGEVTKSYYIFSDLLERFPLDYDIRKYYEKSKEKLLQQCFFMDETSNLQKFEKFRNIYFTLDQLHGGKDVISISGITSIKSASRMIMYLREFSIVSYDKDGFIMYNMSVPYAKMCSFPLDSTNNQFQSFVNERYKTEMIPYVLLKSVDRKDKNIYVEPKYEYFTEDEPFFAKSYIMPVSYDVFSTLCDVSQGAKTMGLFSLWKFIKNAPKYGYSREIFSHAMISRLAYPFILLFLFLIAGTIAWYTRYLRDEQFKLIWLLLFPFLFSAAYVFIEFAKYFVGIILYGILGATGSYALLITLVTLSVLIFCVTFRFAAIRS